MATEALTSLLTLASRLRATEPTRIGTLTGGAIEDAVFVGSGDSLAAALLCENYGHQAKSSGDLAWCSPRSADRRTLVAISSSGWSGATVLAAQKAAEQGIDTIAITASANSPLAEACSRTLVVPQLTVAERVPAAGYVMLSLGVLAACNVDLSDAPALIGDAIEALVEPASRAVDGFPAEVPWGMSVLTLPDMRSAGELWSLKLIEATGLAVRSVPLEESGHVDYFIGPQPHVTVQLVGNEGRERHGELADALERNGHKLVRLDVGRRLSESRDQKTRDDSVTVATGAVGAYVASEVADRFARVPFRNGEVNMDASHIQIARRTH